MQAKRAGKMKMNCFERICYNLMRAERAGKIKIELSRMKRAENFWTNLHPPILVT